MPPFESWVSEFANWSDWSYCESGTVHTLLKRWVPEEVVVVALDVELVRLCS
jgi:hypothetical protein